MGNPRGDLSMVRKENSYLIIHNNRTSHIRGLEETAIEARDKFHPEGQIYLTWSEKTGHTLEMIE